MDKTQAILALLTGQRLRFSSRYSLAQLEPDQFIIYSEGRFKVSEVSDCSSVQEQFDINDVDPDDEWEVVR